MTRIFLCTHLQHPRLTYVCDWIFGEQLGLEWELLPLERAREGNGPVLWYAPQSPPPDFRGLPLYFTGQLLSIAPGAARPDTFQVDNQWYLFPSSHQGGGFDLLAAVFWMLSRVEEYGGHWQPDEFGRFNFQESLNYQEGMLQVPVVDQWVQRFGKILSTHFGIIVQERPARWEPTFDCDITWAFRHKSLFKQLGGWISDLIKGRLDAVLLRPKVWLGLEKDPFDQYATIKALGENGWPVKVFFPVGASSKYDVQADYQNTEYRALVRLLSNSCTIGVHPSFPSMVRESLFMEEIKRLQEIVEGPVTKSRQHYLRFRLPATYRALVKAGVVDEYSMGYAEQTGFRAGTSHSFFWYDLEQETITSMRIHPFCLMDVALRHYCGFKNPEEALAHAFQLLQAVQNTSGVFGTCWHNNSLADQLEWKGWAYLWTEISKKASTLKP